jgi:hypothetical protein
VPENFPDSGSFPILALSKTNNMFNQAELTTLAAILNVYINDVKREQKKSKPGMPIYESMEALIREATPIYDKILSA